jgi:hypothetical protein
VQFRKIYAVVVQEAQGQLLSQKNDRANTFSVTLPFENNVFGSGTTSFSLRMLSSKNFFFS